MSSINRSVSVVVAAMALAAGTGCGGTGKPPDTVAEVGNATITRSMLSHWLPVVAGGDYRQNVGGRAPASLVSEPANLSACVASAESIKPRDSATQAKLPRTALRQKCQQLYQAVKLQALSYLIAVQWRIGEGAEYGEKVTAAELQHKLQQVKAEQFPKPGQFESYLAERHWGVSDELYLLRRNMLAEKFFTRLQREAKRVGGGQATFGKLAQEADQKWTTKTSCKAGYVVWQCVQYRGAERSAPSPAVLLEELAGVTPATNVSPASGPLNAN
jgi:hypothetical protein